MQLSNDDGVSPKSGKKNLLKYGLLGVTLVSGLFSWFSIHNAPNIEGVGAWYVSIAFFSLYIVALLLAAVLVRQEMIMEIVVAVSILLGLIFAFSLWHFIALLLGILLLLAALRNIRKDLDLNVKVDLWKSFYTGKFKIVWGLALIISSQYFFMINATNGQKAIPRFDLGPITTRLIQPVMVMMNPNLKLMQKDNLTVDQFINQSQQKNMEDNLFEQSTAEKMIDEQLPANLTPEQREALKQQALKQVSDSKTQLSQKNKELILQEGRKQLSQMAGREVNGNEKIVDVFSGLVDKRINEFFQPEVGNNTKSSLLSYMIAFILFLTILSMSVLILPIIFAIAILLFKFFIKVGLVEITTVTVQREMIV